MGRDLFGRRVSAGANRPLRRSRQLVRPGGQRIYADRELIKEKVENEDIRLLVSTDAACEGLNLQRFGSQMNVDMPFNPSRSML